MSWYAIFVESGYEYEFCQFINKAKTYLLGDTQFNLLVPRRKVYERKHGIWKEVILKMFPGYVLIQTDSIYQFSYGGREGPHFIRFLKNGYDFLEIQPDEIELILLLADRDGLIDISHANLIQDRLVITDGPLVGREHIIKKIDKRKGRVKVEFTINESIRMIDLGINIHT
ncbi:MAG: antiterminator LoaP [Clostridiales bacterium]|jgi:transcriptional antiterminator NusG|nr:antiterminator LoaP [Clostridiales bacterium]